MKTLASVRFLGTGNAFHSDGFSSQAIWIETEGSARLVDAGPTLARSLEAFGVETDALETVLFTHLHGDHIAGWPFLLLRLVFLDRRARPLRVVGPRGTRARLESLAVLSYGDLLRSDHLPFALEFLELEVADRDGILIDEDLVLATRTVDHDETSIALLLGLGAKTLGISGDTAWCPAIAELVAASDVLVLECTTVAPDPSRHISVSDLRQHASLFAGRRDLLVHTSNAVIEALERDPIAGLRCAQEGERVLLR